MIMSSPMAEYHRQSWLRDSAMPNIIPNTVANRSIMSLIGQQEADEDEEFKDAVESEEQLQAFLKLVQDAVDSRLNGGSSVTQA